MNVVVVTCITMHMHIQLCTMMCPILYRDIRLQPDDCYCSLSNAEKRIKAGVKFDSTAVPLWIETKDLL